MSELALTSSDCLLKWFLCCSQSKTKRKAIICAPPQGGHLTGNNYEVWCSTVFPTEDFFFTFTWALKPFNYCHLIIITSNVSVAGDWQCLGRCGFQRASGFNHHQIELCVWVIKLVPNRSRGFSTVLVKPRRPLHSSKFWHRIERSSITQRLKDF